MFSLLLASSAARHIATICPSAVGLRWARGCAAATSAAQGLSALSWQQLMDRAQGCDEARRAAVARLLAPAPHHGSGGGSSSAVDVGAVNELLRLCAARQAVDEAFQLLGLLERRGVQPDADTFSQLHEVFSYFPKKYD